MASQFSAQEKSDGVFQLVELFSKVKQAKLQLLAFEFMYYFLNCGSMEHRDRTWLVKEGATCNPKMYGQQQIVDYG